MTDTPEYTPPEVWVWEKDDSPNWRYSNTNRSPSRARHAEKSVAARKASASALYSTSDA